MNNEQNNNTGVTPVTNNNQVQTPVTSNTNNQPVMVEANNGQSSVVSPEMVNSSVDNNTVVDDKNLKKIDNEYVPPSKGKTFLLIFFFIFLIGFVFCLPYIESFVTKYKAGEFGAKEEKITTGRLTCELTSNSTNLTYEHMWTFSFSDNKLENLRYVSTTMGDADEDEEIINNAYDKCNTLHEEAMNIQGFTAECESTTGKLIEKQSFEYASIYMEELDAAFVESGGILPTYTGGQDMDDIEKKMNASGATCKREK